MAHDELLDCDIAFALIKSEGLDNVSRDYLNIRKGRLRS